MKKFTNCVFDYCKKGELEGQLAYKLTFNFLNEKDEFVSNSGIVVGEFRYSPLASTESTLVTFDVEIDDSKTPWIVSTIKLTGTDVDILAEQRKQREASEKARKSREDRLRLLVGGNK